MKQILQSYRSGELWLAEVPMAACGRGGALVRTRCSLVSAGTEKMLMSLAKKSLIAKVIGRVDEYKCDPERHDELVRWLEESFLVVMARIEIAAIPWEKVVAGFSEEDGEMVAGFYEHCLVHNRPNSTSR